MSLASAKVYSSSVDIVVSSVKPEVLGTPSLPIDQQHFIATQVELVRSAPVVSEVGARLGGKSDAVDRVDVASVGPTNVIRVTVESDSPNVAKRAANLYGEVFVGLSDQGMQKQFVAAEARLQEKIAATQAQIDKPTTAPADQDTLAKTLSELQSKNAVLVAAAAVTQGPADVAVAAELPTAPSRPGVLQNSLIATALGLLVGAGMVLVLEGGSDRIVTRSDLESVPDASPVFGEIPSARSWLDRNGRRVVIADDDSPIGAAFAQLAEAVAQPSERATLLVAAARSSEGASTVAVNLGQSLARAQRRVVIVDMNLRDPTLGALLELRASGGVAAVLRRESSLREAVTSVPIAGGINMLALPAGRPMRDPSRLLQGDPVAKMLKTLRSGSDIVLLDSPPILEHPDALAIPGIDGVLLVVGAGGARQADVLRAVAEVRRTSVPLVGVVLNFASETGRSLPT